MRGVSAHGHLDVLVGASDEPVDIRAEMVLDVSGSLLRDYEMEARGSSFQLQSYNSEEEFVMDFWSGLPPYYIAAPTVIRIKLKDTFSLLY